MIIYTERGRLRLNCLDCRERATIAAFLDYCMDLLTEQSKSALFLAKPPGGRQFYRNQVKYCQNAKSFLRHALTLLIQSQAGDSSSAIKA